MYLKNGPMGQTVAWLAKIHECVDMTAKHRLHHKNDDTANKTYHAHDLLLQ